MHKIKVIISKFIWKLCGLHWRIGNGIMDIIGYENYKKVMQLSSEKI